MNLSDNITLDQATHSELADKYSIDNNINPEVEENAEIIQNLINIANEICEPIIEQFGVSSINIISFYRCIELERISIDGGLSDNHINGDTILLGDAESESGVLFRWIRKNVKFDKIIFIGNSDSNPDFIKIIYGKGLDKKAYRQNTVGSALISMDVEDSEN